MTDFWMAETTSDRRVIANTTTKLRTLTQQSLQSTWHLASSSLSVEAVMRQQIWQQWAIAPPNAKGHIPWSRGRAPLWLCQQITVPENLNGFPVAGLSLQLGLTWWAEAAAVYVDGQLVQEGDLFDYFARLELSDRVAPGDTFTVAIYLVSPGHDDGALVRSDLFYESRDAALPEPGFVADELTVLQTFAEKLAPAKLAEIAAAIAPLNWSTVSDQAACLQELAALRMRLHPLSAWIKQRQITCTGHAHLDLAWLWPVTDTWRAAERTFRSVLALQQDFPELTYTHSSPALFDWLETHRPELFQAVLGAVEQGAWSMDAGLWVEPELQTLGGESLARQILYGQRYARSRFGQVSTIAWLPDSFGFSWQLPQLLQLGGIDYFATQKLRWNEMTTFPHGLFWWQGLDGTCVMSLTLPPIGTDIDAAQMATHSAEWQVQTGLTETLWLPGMGDHGGGPTRDMLHRARRWAASPFFPQLEFDTPLNHLRRITEAMGLAIPPLSENGIGKSDLLESVEGKEKEFPSRPCSYDLFSHPPRPPSTLPTDLPVWNDELYLELHRGCYTVHADQKWYNRRCEDTLREAELYGAIAQMLGHFSYPRAALEAAWKRVLFNQFHDILPGTAIPEVFATANPDWQAAYDTAKTTRTAALAAIAEHLFPGSPPYPDALPLYVFNSLNWEQTHLAAVALSDLPTDISHWSVLDPTTGKKVVTQLSSQSDCSETAPCQPLKSNAQETYLLFEATVPPVGYRLYWLIPKWNSEQLRKSEVGSRSSQCSLQSAKHQAPSTKHQAPKVSNLKSACCLENEHIRAEIDAHTGELKSLIDKAAQTNVVRSSANQLQAFRDAGQYWDAWDIAPNYQDHPLPAATVETIEWLESGPLRQRLRVVRHIADSRIQQDYVLERSQRYLKVVTLADWQATQVVLKVAFPLSFGAAEAIYEIPFGAISRPTNPTDPHEQAKWEVPAYRWASLSDGHRGLSILTDYKHGFDAQPDHLRLTLLKAPLWPDPQADRGRHQFTYGLYPHGGDWRTGQTPQHAIAFNTPLQVVIAPVKTEARSPVPWQATFLDLATEGAHLAALKPAEDTPEHYILRVWELYGQGTTVSLNGSVLERTNLLEEAIVVHHPTQLEPWQIATFKVPSLINESWQGSPRNSL